MNTLIIAAAVALLAFGLFCLATLPFLEDGWLGVAQMGIVLGSLYVGIVVFGFVAYPLAVAEADVRRCKECPEESGEA